HHIAYHTESSCPPVSRIVYINTVYNPYGQCLQLLRQLFHVKQSYFPIQNLSKISPSMSSGVVSPVICPKASNASRRSMARSSKDGASSSEVEKRDNVSTTFWSTSLCLASERNARSRLSVNLPCRKRSAMQPFKVSTPSPVDVEIKRGASEE